MWEFEEANSKICGDINTLHSVALQYGYGGLEAEKRTLHYLRNIPKYTGGSWPTVAGNIDNRYINAVNAQYPNLSYFNSEIGGIYLNDSKYGKMDLSHWAATTNGMLFSSIYFLGHNYGIKVVGDLCGWAGDLQTLINQSVRQVGLSADYGTFRASVFVNIGIDEQSTCFSMPDLLADMDAYYIANHSRTSLMGNELLNYYKNIPSNTRFIYFINGRSLSQLRSDVMLYTTPFGTDGAIWPLMDYVISSDQSIATADAFASRIFQLSTN